MIEQGCGGVCAAMQRYLSDNITAFTAGMQNIAQKYKLADIAVSEWSLSSNHRDSRGCVDCLSIMYEGQATAFYDLVGLPRVVCIQVIVELRDTGSQVDHGGQRHSEMAV